MKKLALLAVGICCLGILTPGSALAAKGDKKKDKKNVDVFAKYDKNSNGVLDDEEKAAVKKAFDKDAALKVYDTNNDGKLDDAEVSAIKAAAKKKKKKDK